MGVKYKQKLGERIVKISDTLRIPRATVESVIRAYLDDLIESAKSGETVVIDNIASIHVKQTVTGEVTLRGRVSPALKNKIYAEKVGEPISDDLAELAEDEN